MSLDIGISFWEHLKKYKMGREMVWHIGRSIAENKIRYVTKKLFVDEEKENRELGGQKQFRAIWKVRIDN